MSNKLQTVRPGLEIDSDQFDSNQHISLNVPKSSKMSTQKNIELQKIQNDQEREFEDKYKTVSDKNSRKSVKQMKESRRVSMITKNIGLSLMDAKQIN